MRSSIVAAVVVLASGVLGLFSTSARAATPESDALKEAKAAIKLRLAEAKADQAATAATLLGDLALLQGNIAGGAVPTPDIPQDLVGTVVAGMVQLYRDSHSVVGLAAQDIFNIYDAANLDVPPALQAGSGGDVDKMRLKLDSGNAKLFKKIAATVKKLVGGTNKALSAGYRLNAMVLPFPPVAPVLASQTSGTCKDASQRLSPEPPPVREGSTRST